MCGIAGIIAGSGWGANALEKVSSAMANTMVHRGPDAHDTWVCSKLPLALSHRRLAIQDLSSRGNQPMVSGSGRFCIVFNGEIYNFLEIAKELCLCGYQFQGHSDTEVLIAAIEAWGIEKAVQKSQGMFAFGLWDEQTKELTLCRDRLGEKPLYFGWLQGCFVFASELKAFQQNFRNTLEIDKHSMAAYFRFGYVPTPHSIYKHIYKLLPGSFLCLSVMELPSEHQFSPFPGGAQISPKPYWELEKISRFGVINPIIKTYDAIQKLDNLLHDVIKNQKIADVPLGCFLSGGVDSSLVAALLQNVSATPINTFTIGFREKEFDEAPFARAIAAHIGSKHHEYYVSANEGLDEIEKIPEVWDEPFSDSSQIPSLIVARKARQQVSVCLTGDGGDELFCGYNRYYATAQLWKYFAWLPKCLRYAGFKAFSKLPHSFWQSGYNIIQASKKDGFGQANFGLKMNKMIELLKINSLPDAYRYLMSYWNQLEDVLTFTKEADSVMDLQPEPELGNFIHDSMYWDQIGYLADDNLVKGDRASMSVSLETRLPLLDHRIVELSWHLPLSMKFYNGQSKWILRQILYRYVPKEMIERPKMGFSVPIRSWLKGPLKNWAEDLLFSKNVRDSGMFNYPSICKLWRQHQKGSHDHSHKLWTLLTWLNWYEYQR